METLHLLGTAMGLSALAGINLYLTVFVTGLAINLGWLQLAPGLDKLAVLGDPIVLVVAGVMLVLETIVDKVPYADSGWDTIHTAIRPIGGAILSLSALGELSPQLDVVGALLGGAVAFTTHSAKAGTRLMVNTSPEPASNIVVSIGEDVVVLGGLWFVFQHPIISLVIVVTFFVAFWYFAPKLFRMIKAYWTAIWHRFTRKPAAGDPLPTKVPGFALESWLAIQRDDEDAAWVLPCYTGKMKSIGRNVRGVAIGTTEGRLVFIGKKNFRVRYLAAPLAEAKFTDDPGTLFHRLIVKPADGEQVRLRFTRRHSPLLPAALRWLEERAQPVREPVTV